MKKVCILQNKVLHYRKPLYNKLSETFDLTIIHTGNPTVNEQDDYKEIIIPAKKRGPFVFQKDLIALLKKGHYDKIIGMLDIHWFTIIRAYFKFKSSFIWWGIGVSDKNVGNKIRAFFLKKGTPMIFYTKDGIEAFKKLGLDSKKFFHCNNTFHIENRIKCYESPSKTSILFVGSLDERKQNSVLINAFKNILPKIKNEITLDIIGAGKQEQVLKELTKTLQLESRVIFHGAINDTSVLENFYKKAICSVSFGQAGLAVLQSLGYGVPFITKKNAISGGEKSNILNGKNGFLIDDDINDLAKHIQMLCLNDSLSKELGEFAYHYYTNNCTLNNMAHIFTQAINR